MRKSLVDKNKDFLVDIQNKLISQSESGQVGRELKKDVLVDLFGSRQDIGGEVSEIIADESGTPQIQNIRFSLLLDCGHTVYSREGVGGRCDHGHIICAKEKLYTCAYCRAKLCDRDAVFWNRGYVTCSRRKCQRKWQKGMENLDKWEEENNRKAKIPDIYKF